VAPPGDAVNVVLSCVRNPDFEALPDYLAAALLRLGHRVTLFDHRRGPVPGRLRRALPGLEAFDRQKLNQSFVRAVRRARADLVVVNQGMRLLPETIRALRSSGVRCINWFSDYPAEFELGLFAAPAYDAFYLGSSFAAARHREAGHTQAAWLPFACDPEVHRPPLQGDPPPPRPPAGRVVLVGSHYPERQVLLRYLAGLPVDVFGPGWERAQGDPHVAPMIRGGALRPAAWRGLFSGAAAVLNIHYGAFGPVAASGEMANTRLFEVAACGGAQVVDRRADVLQLFRDGEEIAGFSSGDELRAQVTSLLADPDRGRRLGRAARARALASHTYLDRARVLLGEAATPACDADTKAPLRHASAGGA
jgi:spore maturation protein CgeB